MSIQSEINRINTEVDTQDNLISQIKGVLNARGVGGDSDAQMDAFIEGMTLSTPIENNTGALRELLQIANDLPEAGVDTSDATATAADIVSPKTAYVNGTKVDGTLGVFPNNQNPINPDLLLSYMGNQKTSAYILPYSYYTGEDKVLKTDSTVSIQISNSSLASTIGLTADKIVSGNTIIGVAGSVVLQKYYTGSSAPSSSLGNNGDIYLMVG